jgi:hypothetical protein
MKKLTIILISLMMIFGCKKETIIEEPITQNEVLTGEITGTKKLTSDKTWILKGYVYVTDGSKLIIEPGTRIESDLQEKGALCIERGAQIIAEGTAMRPIVFTSAKPDGEKSPGDWGGIVILGKAKTNRSSEPTIEGGIGRKFGGTDDNDNSGVLKYVRIEYAGVAAMPNSEINALTLAGVGRGTVIENVQTIYANDDAFEFFGGTVNCKNLFAYATADDDFDFDFGYTGTISYSICKRDPKFVDNGDAGNGIECDNDGIGSSATPTTHPKLYYMTMVGPNDSTALSNHNLGIRFRRATNFTIENSFIVGWMKGGFSMESDETATSYKNGISVFKNNVVYAFNSSSFISKSPVITSSEVSQKALSEGNQVSVSLGLDQNFYPLINTDKGALTQGNWLNGWTRMPQKGF